MTVRVSMDTKISLQPRAECLGDDCGDDESNCGAVWGYNSGTVASVKAHIRANPTHQVIVVHETHSMYGANN